MLAGLFAVLIVVTAALMARDPGHAKAGPVRDGPPEREVVTGETPGSLRAAYLDPAAGEVVS